MAELRIASEQTLIVCEAYCVGGLRNIKQVCVLASSKGQIHEGSASVSLAV